MANQSRFFFAWAGSGEGFSNAHHREDELIFSFEFKHEEGQFAELELEIVNPKRGLLNGPLWAWFSWGDGSGVYPIFYGRLVGIPDDLFLDVIKIKLIARPPSYAAQRQALSDSLKVLPYYDPIFIDGTKLDDPDTALEGYSALWHVDRFAQGVSVSDILYGEDGYVYFNQGEAFYDSVSMKVAGAPLLACEVNAEVSWTQCDNTGVFEMKTVPNMGEVTSVNGKPTGVTDGATFSTPASTASNGTSISPPKQEEQQQQKERQQVTSSWTYKNISPGPHSDGDLMEESGSVTDPFYGGELIKKNEVRQNADKETGQGEEYSIEESYKWTYTEQGPNPPPPSFPSPPPDTTPPSGGGGPTETPKPTPINNSTSQVAIELEQERAEAIYVAMRASVQPVLVAVSEDEDDLIESISMNARDLVVAGVVSPSEGAYFATARGQQSIEYLLMVARAHLLAGSRIVEVEWECPFSKIVYSGMNCRMNAYIADDRIPGGAAAGKIVTYELKGDGDKGEFTGGVTINCAVGDGGSPVLLSRGEVVAPMAAGDVIEAGTPVYVEEGYVDPGYQHYEGRMISAITGDVSYSPLSFAPVGLQLPVTQDQIILRHEYYDGAESGELAQIIADANRLLLDYKIDAIGQPITSPPEQALRYNELSRQVDQIIAQAYADHPSYVEMEIAPTRNITARAEFATDVSHLTVPRQISLTE